MDFLSLAPIIESVAGGAIGSGLLHGPLKSLDDWWYYQFGNKTELAKEKAKLLNEAKLQEYKNEIFEQVKKIPSENIKEPQLNIIGPALEASKYYIDAPELRRMFAKLVASSVDNRVNGKTRSAFVEFVKQMDSLDARLISIIHSANGKMPLARLDRSFSNNRGYQPILSEIIPNNTSITPDERAQIPSAIINLNRLGLVSYRYDEWLTSFDYDKNFALVPEYLEAKKQYSDQKAAYQAVLNSPQKAHLDKQALNDIEDLVNGNLKITHGIVTLTNLGNDFSSVCL